ncbi:hypothetical protein OROMI_017988 [Orobanche minor]
MFSTVDRSSDCAQHGSKTSLERKKKKKGPWSDWPSSGARNGLIAVAFLVLVRGGGGEGRGWGFPVSLKLKAENLGSNSYVVQAEDRMVQVD